mgnify:CR=1 FL=1
MFRQPDSLYAGVLLCSAIILAVVGGSLFLLRMPGDERLRNYRLSRRFVGWAYFSLAFTDVLWLLFLREEYELDFTRILVLAVAAVQATMFSGALVTLVNSRFPLARGVRRHLLAVAAGTASLFGCMLFFPQAFPVLFRLTAAAYCVQIALFARIFVREYRVCRRKLDNFFSDGEMRRLRWVAVSFLMTALIGLTAAAWLVSGLGMPYLFAFTGVYMVFYTFFGMKYINYPAEFGRIAPVIADDVPEPLAAGDYELYEVAAPYGYVLSDQPVPFTIDGSEAVVTVTQYNMPQKGQLTITKTGEVFASVQENDGLYQPVYEVAGLPGAVYDVIADEDIYTGDGTLRAEKDTVVETLTTGEDGSAKSGPLYLGRYRLEERQAPSGCVLNPQPEYVELTYAGETVEVTQTAAGLYDERQKVDVTLFKAMETDDLFGLGMNEEYKDISFGLYASADLTATDGSVIPAGGLLEVVSVSSVESGGYSASFASDLPFGSYYVKERTTNGAYILSDQEYPVVFEYAGQETALVQILVNEGEAVSNELLRGRVDGVKVGENPEGGEDVTLAGALMGLFRPDTEEFTEENALLTAITGKDGSFSFENIPYGHWIVKEISAPDLYTVSPQQHHVYIGADGQHIEIRVENTLIRGSVQVTKTEAVEEPSPVEKEDKKDKNSFLRFLSGAVFDLYADSNANQEYDPDDQKIGTLKETDAGYHTAENLLAGGYFIKESKAPEGYQPDSNAYYFSITEDGQVAVVENGEAGHGFTNEAYRGNLKITKNSSDGRKDGFAIEVKSADGSYCETFTTPKSGVIEVKGLRVGIYTVTEVANRASKDYIIPDAATVEIKADQTSTVQFFNEKPEKPDNPKNPEKPSVPSNPSTPQKPVPQTGDDPYIFLYGGLLAAALIGGSVFAVYYFKKGKYSRTSPKRTAVGVSVLSLCVLVALGSGFLVFRDLNQYAESKDAYRDLAGYVEVPEQTASPESAPDPTEPKRDDTDIVLPSVDFETLRENGPDIIGWLSLPDTVLNYPVTQTDNNEYYLNHLYDGTYNKVGCLFADYENRADFSDRNTIIYGHNMRDGSMFALLNRYDEQSYFDAHRQMYLVTPKGGYVMEIFAAFAAKPEESGSETSPWQLSWKDDGAYTTWLTAMKERSAVESDVTVTCSDKVLTLSTCTPGGTGRFLVMGKLVKVDNEI